MKTLEITEIYSCKNCIFYRNHFCYLTPPVWTEGSFCRPYVEDDDFCQECQPMFDWRKRQN